MPEKGVKPKNFEQFVGRGKKFQKGYIPWNKGMKFPQWSQEGHPNWKGKSIKYDGLHRWVYLKLGKPDTCKHCGKNGLKGIQIQWANKSGRYLRELKDWIRLCAGCHKKYDVLKRKKKREQNFRKCMERVNDKKWCRDITNVALT